MREVVVSSNGMLVWQLLLTKHWIRFLLTYRAHPKFLLMPGRCAQNGALLDACACKNCP